MAPDANTETVTAVADDRDRVHVTHLSPNLGPPAGLNLSSNAGCGATFCAPSGPRVVIREGESIDAEYVLSTRSPFGRSDGSKQKNLRSSCVVVAERSYRSWAG
jgi:hypothetical protein